MRVAFGVVGPIIAEGAWPAHSAQIEWAMGPTIPRADGPMNTSQPDPTIDQLFEQFLADQEARLSSKTYGKYEGIIDLYRSYLERYWPGHSGTDYDAVTGSKGTYCGTYGAADITSGFSEFLGYFMPRKVIAGNETMKAAGTVLKKLARWLVEKGTPRTTKRFGSWWARPHATCPPARSSLTISTNGSTRPGRWLAAGISHSSLMPMA